MAWTHVREAGTPVANASSSTTLVFTVGASGCQVGDTLVAIIAADNSGTNGAAPSLSIADTGGNTWAVRNVSLRDPGAANAGTCCWIADCLVTTALVSGNTITATFNPAVVAKAMSIREFAGGAQTTTAADRLALQNGTNGASTTPSANLNPATLTDYLMIGAVAAECGTADTFNQDTDTTNGSWVDFTRAGAGTTTSGQTIAGAYKIVTANGSQTYNPTLGTSRDWAEKVVALRAAVDLASTALNGTSTVTADLTVTAGGAQVDLDSTDLDGTSSTTFDMTVDRGLASTDLNGTSTVTAAMAVAVALASTALVGGSTVTGDMAVAVALSATVDGTSTVAANMAVAVALQATSDGTSTVTAALDVDSGGEQVDLASDDLDGTSGLTANMVVAVALAATSAGTSSVTATLITDAVVLVKVSAMMVKPVRRGRWGKVVAPYQVVTFLEED
jgi:hypothetical protein